MAKATMLQAGPTTPWTLGCTTASRNVVRCITAFVRQTRVLALCGPVMLDSGMRDPVIEASICVKVVDGGTVQPTRQGKQFPRIGLSSR